MSPRRSLRTAARAAAVLLGGLSTAAAEPPVEAFARLPAMARPHLSPDGTHLSYTRDLGGRPVTVVVDLSTADRRETVLPFEDLTFDAVWASDTRLILRVGEYRYVRGPRHEPELTSRAIAVDADGGNVVGLLAGNAAARMNINTGRVSDLTIEEPDHVFMPLFVAASAGYRNDLFQVDIHTGDGAVVARGKPDTVSWLMDGHGTIVGRVDENERRARQTLYLMQDGAFVESMAAEIVGGEGLGVLGISADGSGIMHWQRDPGGRRIMARRDLATGETRSVLARPPHDLSLVWYDDWTQRVIGSVWSEDRAHAFFFEPELQALQSEAEAQWPGRTVLIESLSADRRTAIVSVESPREPISFHLIRAGASRTELVGRAYPELAPDDLGEMIAWPYKARDGLDIPAYLTLPPGKAARNLPLVVLPHGGPDARDQLSFDWMAQFIASRGYAVLQPNFRGSSGYGKAFTEAGLRQWGLKMQDDLSDGVLKAIADGIADPARVCIVGASYGGYAALAGATLTPDLYACAVSIAGVSDLPKMILHERKRYGSDSTGLSFWISRIGSPVDDSAQLRATSPARHANAVRCPILLMHGARDITVPIEQSEVMAHALKRAGKPVSFIRFETDDHHLQYAATRAEALRALEAFLASTIGS